MSAGGTCGHVRAGMSEGECEHVRDVWRAGVRGSVCPSHNNNIFTRRQKEGRTWRVNLEVVHNDGARRLLVLAHGFNCDVSICRELNCSWLMAMSHFTHTHHKNVILHRGNAFSLTCS